MQRQPAQGVIEGYVYWGGGTIKHSPPNSCSGLSVTASIGSTALTATTTFAYAGSVGNNAVCRYSVKGLPIEQALQVQANVTSSSAFSPTALPSGGSQTIILTKGAPLCAPGGPSNPSASELSAGWTSCAYVASSVNFILVPAKGLMTPYGTRMPSVSPGGPVELSPQPYPPKNGTLLSAGSQKTLLGDGSVRPDSAETLGSSQTTSAAALNDGSKVGSTPAPSKGQGRNEYDAVTLQSGATQDPGFANWANSQARSVAAGPARTGIRENPNLYVAQACAKDSAFRVLFISGTSDGKTLAAGHYTLWGCSFGTAPLVKPPRPPNAVSHTATPVPQSQYAIAIYSAPLKVAWFVYADIVSWSDNSIVISVSSSAATYPDASVAGMIVPAELWVTRGDGQTTIYGHEGGLYFKPAN